jgi:hypothetical protein
MNVLSTMLGGAWDDDKDTYNKFCEGSINDEPIFELYIINGKHLLYFSDRIRRSTLAYDDIYQLLQLAKTRLDEWLSAPLNTE